MKAPKLSAGEIEAHFARDFPQGDFGPNGLFRIERVGMGAALVRMKASDSVLRPGGTVSGASMMTLADATMYVAILASIGWVPLAVTTSLNINFLRKPAAGDVLAECKLLKLGKRLTVGEVAIRSEGEEELVAHCTATYSI
ncbi:MAG TPA: PaaI family thioesterase, partial [Xanthobacteraceae bacterium]|nr:PaaI family thioesterase [Xanthobacteraceae bacterium]